MKVQEFLKEKGPEALASELGITIRKHDDLPLMILNYNQIDSPKLHPIVRECRGLVLRSDDYSLVARSFSRFFNWGEVPDEMGSFDFSDFSVESKEDGSLALVFCFDGQWMVATRGSFADGQLPGFSGTWSDAILAALGASTASLDDFLDPKICYVGEFCSPWNKVVRHYETPTVFLLTAFEGERELSQEEMTEQWDLGACAIFGTSRSFHFSDIRGIQDFLGEVAKSDPTFEGVVIKDRSGQRWKIKSPSYLSLHRLRGEGDNLYHPKHLLPFVLNGEEAELLTYFPEAKEAFLGVKSKVADAYTGLVEAWGDHHTVVDQKEFAMYVKSHPFSSILFTVRRRWGEGQRSFHIREEWRNSEQLILKKLFATGS